MRSLWRTSGYWKVLIDRLLIDIETGRGSRKAKKPFGGKAVLFSGDFRQILPVIRRGGRTEMIQNSVLLANFWHQIKLLRLTKNMRLCHQRPGVLKPKLKD